MELTKPFGRKIMRFHADVQIHSKYSRATSKDADLEHMALWAAKKGVTVIGTGDFTHPAWRAQIKEKLVPAEPGLYRLRPDLEEVVARLRPAACQSEAEAESSRQPGSIPAAARPQRGHSRSARPA